MRLEIDEIIYEDNFVKVYKCGCRESKLESLEHYIELCKKHKKDIKYDY